MKRYTLKYNCRHSRYDIYDLHNKARMSTEEAVVMLLNAMDQQVCDCTPPRCQLKDDCLDLPGDDL